MDFGNIRGLLMATMEVHLAHKHVQKLLKEVNGDFGESARLLDIETSLNYVMCNMDEFLGHMVAEEPGFVELTFTGEKKK